MSVAVTVKLYAPVFIGVPEIDPEFDKERPGGSSPVVIE
jgi:hypothetical protein